MNVLVTGATGFIGHHVVPRLLHLGHRVIAVSRDEGRARRFEWFGQVKFVAFHLEQPIKDAQALFGHPDAVMHLAWPGLPNYRESFHMEQALPASYGLIHSLVEGGVRQVLVTGTCLEYGMQAGELAEDAPALPVTQYGLAKNSLHRALESLQSRHDFTLQWARLFYMHGEGQNRNSLLAQLDRAIANRDPTFNMSGGEQLRDYLPVEEVAARLVMLLETPGCNGVVNICSGMPVSVLDVVKCQIAKRHAAIELRLGHFPYPDYEPMAYWGSSRKFLSRINEADATRQE